MKIPILCTHCSSDAMLFKSTFQQVHEDGVYSSVCLNKHSSVIILQAYKFEILFEIASRAFFDNYFREAIITYSTSLERFFEYYIEVVAAHREIAEEEFYLTWKQLSKLSERQIGVFLYVYLQENAQSYQLLDNKMTELRNKVIHGGYIPSESEAKDYGRYVYNSIVFLMKNINEKMPAAKEKRATKRTKDHFKIAETRFAHELKTIRDSGYGISVMTLGLELSTINPDIGDKTFEQAYQARSITYRAEKRKQLI